MQSNKQPPKKNPKKGAAWAALKVQSEFSSISLLPSQSFGQTVTGQLKVYAVALYLDAWCKGTGPRSLRAESDGGGIPKILWVRNSLNKSFVLFTLCGWTWRSFLSKVSKFWKFHGNCLFGHHFTPESSKASRQTCCFVQTCNTLKQALLDIAQVSQS